MKKLKIHVEVEIEIEEENEEYCGKDCKYLIHSIGGSEDFCCLYQNIIENYSEYKIYKFVAHYERCQECIDIQKDGKK